MNGCVFPQTILVERSLDFLGKLLNDLTAGTEGDIYKIRKSHCFIRIMEIS
jgi:hypothetical protein